MSVSGKVIAKNIGVLMSSQLLTWGLTLLLTLFLPRYLGPTAVGQFYLVAAIWGIATAVAVFGMDTHLTKEVARNPDAAAGLLGSSLFLRYCLFLVTCVVVAAYAYLSNRSTSTMIILGIGAVVTVITMAGSAYSAVLQGLEVMEYVSLGQVVNKTVNTLLCLALIFLDAGLYLISAAGIVSASLSLVILYRALQRTRPLRLTVERSKLRGLLRASAPYLAVGITLIAYQQINTLVIASVLSEQLVGWYSTAGTLFGTLLFVPVVFATALFPAVSRSYARSPQQLGSLIGRSVNLMLLLGVPMTLGLIVVADNLTVLLYGPAFAPGGAVLATMGIALTFTFLNILYGQLLVATDRTNDWTKTMVAATVAMFVLATTLVPWSQRTFGNGAIGGALSFVITELAMSITGTLLLPKGTFTWTNVRTGALTLVAGVVMFLAASWFKTALLPIPVAVGALTFAAAVVLLRVIPREDVQFLRELAAIARRRFGPRAKDPIGINGD
jgi:O-antigen/teichoic acid export membrane protein